MEITQIKENYYRFSLADEDQRGVNHWFDDQYGIVSIMYKSNVYTFVLLQKAPIVLLINKGSTVIELKDQFKPVTYVDPLDEYNMEQSMEMEFYSPGVSTTLSRAEHLSFDKVVYFKVKDESVQPRVKYH